MPALYIWDPLPENRGKCNICPDYMVPNDDNTECIAYPETCPPETKLFQGENGPECKFCPHDSLQCSDNKFMCCITVCPDDWNYFY